MMRAHIYGGKQLVYGFANSATIFTGSQIVEAGGTASNTTVTSGGECESVVNGGVDEVGNGVVDIRGESRENDTYEAGGSGE